MQLRVEPIGFNREFSLNEVRSYQSRYPFVLMRLVSGGYVAILLKTSLPRKSITRIFWIEKVKVPQHSPTAVMQMQMGIVPKQFKSVDRQVGVKYISNEEAVNKRFRIYKEV